MRRSPQGGVLAQPSLVLGRPQAERQAGNESLDRGRVQNGHGLQHGVDLPAVQALVLIHKGPARVGGGEVGGWGGTERMLQQPSWEPVTLKRGADIV